MSNDTPPSASSPPRASSFHTEELFRLVIENVEDYAVFAIDLEGNAASWNPSVEKLLGYTEEQFVGLDVCRIFTPEDNAQGACAYELQTAKEKERAESQRWHLRKDGSRFWAKGLMMSLRDEAGELRGYAKIMRDDTARKQMDDKQPEAARLAALSMDISIALTRSESLPDTLRLCAEAMVRHLDAAFARIWTLNEQEQVLELQASAGMYTHMDGAHSRVPVGQFKIGLIAQEREPRLTNDVANDPRVGDHEWARREGMVAFAGYPLVVEDQLVGVMAMFARHQLTDATLRAMATVANGIALGIERKRSEEELRKSQERFKLIARATNDAIWDWNLVTNEVWWNEGVRTMFGYAPQQVGGDAAWWYECIHPEDRERVVTGIHAVIDHGSKSWSDEYRYRRADSGYTHVLDRGFALHDAAGKPIRMLGSMLDLTERKRAEAERRRAGEEQARLRDAMLRMQEARLEELSTPLIPLSEGVVMMPLIGMVDERRADRMLGVLLDGVRAHAAKIAILDVTGMTLVDTHVAGALVTAAHAVRLLGAEAVLTGIRADVAQTLVQLGVDLTSLTTRKSLADGLEYANERRRSSRHLPASRAIALTTK
jgi:PAS domain S-box-containing protein